jgi:hypothetical protein
MRTLMKRRRTVAILIASALLLTATGCASQSSGSHQLRMINLSILASGDEHDEIGASDNGEWWVIGRYPSNRVILLDIRKGTFTTIAGLRRVSGAPYEVTNSGKVEMVRGGAEYPDLALDRTDSGERLSVTGSTVLLTSARGTKTTVATGYPRSTDPELSTSFSAGTISGDGEIVTVPTTRPYARADRNHSVDIYQFDLRTGRVTWVSRGNRPGGEGVAASSSGRFVVYDGQLAGSKDAQTAGERSVALRWDRASGKTTPISLTDGGDPGRLGVTGQFSVADDGAVAFVSNDCNLTNAPPPSGELACLYVSAPA